MKYLRIRTPGAKPETNILSHHYFDGIGGMAKVLREHATLPSVSLPVYRGPVPSALRILYITLRAIFRNLPAVAVARLKQSFDPKAPSAGERNSLAYLVFDDQESGRIRNRCREANVFVNSYFMWAGTRAMAPWVHRDTGPITWHMSVNVRGAVEQSDPLANHVGHILIHAGVEDDLRITHSTMFEKLREEAFWGGWITLSSFAGWAGIPRAVKTARLLRGGKNWNAVFSGLGKWPLTADEERRADDYAWIFVPFVTSTYPFSLAGLEWKGRFTFSAHVNPRVSADPAAAQEFMDRFKKIVLEGDEGARL